MTIRGMDVEEAERLVGQLEAQANAINHVVSIVDNAVSVLGSLWFGADLQHFQGTWRGNQRAQANSAAVDISHALTILRREIDAQRKTSGGGHASTRSHGGVRTGTGGSRQGGGSLFADLVTGGTNGVLFLNELIETADDIVGTARGEGHGFVDKLPGGRYLSSVMKGIGLGDSLAGVATGLRDHDYSGAMGSAADGVFTFAPNPVSLLWTGLKAEVGFFIPLDAESADKHMSWMESRGYSGEQLIKRYSGVQGFINLGNDNVERKAPWMNRAADVVMQKPAEWLYNVGIRF